MLNTVSECMTQPKVYNDAQTYWYSMHPKYWIEDQFDERLQTTSRCLKKLKMYTIDSLNNLETFPYLLALTKECRDLENFSSFAQLYCWPCTIRIMIGKWTLCTELYLHCFLLHTLYERVIKSFILCENDAIFPKINNYAITATLLPCIGAAPVK